MRPIRRPVAPSGLSLHGSARSRPILFCDLEDDAVPGAARIGCAEELGFSVRRVSDHASKRIITITSAGEGVEHGFGAIGCKLENSAATVLTVRVVAGFCHSIQITLFVRDQFSSGPAAIV